jgi:hypothetical protein
MDEPARKRRRTSSPLERASSPLRKPARRPSFASPTKASLARHHPNLLASRQTPTGSPSRPSSRGDILARGKQAPASTLGERDVQEELRQETTNEDGNQDTRGGAQLVTPRARKIAGQRDAPNATSVVEEEEPELPTTPSQQGLEEADSPRRGILFSSPSKRPPRAKGLVTHSPLRPKAPAVQEALSAQHVEDGPGVVAAPVRKEKKQPPNPEMEKREQEKARLQREIAELEAQVSKCTEEIVKEQQRAPAKTLRASDRSDLQAFVSKISGAGDNAGVAVPVSSLLCSFLPFSTISKPQRTRESDDPVPSHKPIELADPLPYLEMFTTMKYTTQLHLPRGKIVLSSKHVHQKHTIDIVGPQKLLVTQVSVVIDTLASEIIDMHILHLSSWAERELGTFLRQRSEAQELGNASWAIESYWEIAQKRAHYWHRCETTFSHLLAGQTREDTENARPQAKQDTKLTRRALNRHLGRDTLILQDRHVLLKLNWRIGFDWTGEAESEVTVEPAFPSVWTEGDAEKRFSKVPETFASLLQSRGAFEATRIMAALLFAQ